MAASTRWTIGCLLAACLANAHQEAAATPSSVCSWVAPGPLALDDKTQQCPLVIDDYSAARKKIWAPWTYRPHCVRGKGRKRQKYCAYTYAPFRGGSGLSIMTTPDVATNVVDLLEDPNPAWLHSFAPSWYLPADPWPYEIRDLPGKGKGAVANRTIHRGEVILRELPVLITHMDEFPSISKTAVRDMLQVGFDQLPEKDRTRVLQMARSKGGHVIDDIMKTNVFGIFLHDVEHSGLYPEIGRLNHACRPNAVSRFNKRTLVLEIVAYEDIQPGQEVTISYVPLNLLHTDRRYLLRGWSFECTCPLCASRGDIAISDRNRRRIEKIFADMKLIQNATPERLGELAKELLALAEKEKLTAQVGDFAGIIAAAYLDIDEPARAKEFAQMALDEQIHFKGVDSDPAERMREMLRDLEDAERRQLAS